jgi:hypothetical protein
MMKTLMLAGVASVGIGVGTASAQPLPNFDVQAACRNVSLGIAVLGPQYCVMTQYQMRTAAGYVWSKLPPAKRQECITNANGDYLSLFSCVESYSNEPASPSEAPAPVAVPPVQPASVQLPAPVAAPLAPPAAAQPVSAPPPAPPVDPEFQRGLDDRTLWEQWFEAQTSRSRDGAEYWAAHRSDKPQPQCDWFVGGDDSFRQGCLAAKERLDLSDRLRKTSPAYRQGWNSYGDQPPAAELTPSPTGLSPRAAVPAQYPMSPKLATDIPLENDRGGLFLSATLNGSGPYRFQLDTGASTVVIPRRLLVSMVRGGYISEAEYEGPARAELADGHTVQAWSYRLRSVTLGGLTVHNVRCMVGGDETSMLIGQSVLENFGHVEIDYHRNVLHLTA